MLRAQHKVARLMNNNENEVANKYASSKAAFAAEAVRCHERRLQDKEQRKGEKKIVWVLPSMRKREKDANNDLRMLPPLFFCAADHPNPGACHGRSPMAV